MTLCTNQWVATYNKRALKQQALQWSIMNNVNESFLHSQNTEIYEYLSIFCAK